MTHTENYICGFFYYDQTWSYFPWNEVTPWQTLLSSWRNVQLVKQKDQLWPSGMWYCVSSQKTSNDRHQYDNFKWHMRLDDLSLSLTWHSHICPKLAQTIFLIVTLILSSTYTCLSCSSSHLTSFAEILYPVTCPA